MTGMMVIFRSCFANEPKNIAFMICGLKYLPSYLFFVVVSVVIYLPSVHFQQSQNLFARARACVRVLNVESVFILNYILACFINIGRRV